MGKRIKITEVQLKRLFHLIKEGDKNDDIVFKSDDDRLAWELIKLVEKTLADRPSAVSIPKPQMIADTSGENIQSFDHYTIFLDMNSGTKLEIAVKPKSVSTREYSTTMGSVGGGHEGKNGETFSVSDEVNKKIIDKVKAMEKYKNKSSSNKDAYVKNIASQLGGVVA